MKQLFTYLLLLLGLTAGAQSLPNVSQLGQTNRNQKVGNGFQVDDTLLSKGIVRFSAITGTGKVLVPNDSGYVSAQSVTSISKVDSIWRVPGQDSIKYSIAGRNHAILDSTGAASSEKLIFVGQYSTVSSSAGLGISADWVYFGSILIPGGTVQAGDMIEVETFQIGNGASTLTPTWALRDQASAPLSTDALGVAGANGTSYIVMFNATGVYNCGMRHQFIAKSPGFYIGSTGGFVGNSVINHYTFQSISTGTTYADNTTMSWATDKYIVAAHRSAAAATMTHVLTTVKIYRP